MGKKIESVKKSDTEKATPKPAARKTKSTVAKAAKPPAARKKAPVTGASVKSAATKKNAVAAIPSSDDIALRAYYIAEHRQRHGIHGDPARDWLEAERQLLAERGLKKAR